MKKEKEEKPASALKRIQAQLRLSGADAILIRSAVNRQFATGFRSSEGLAVVTAKKGYLLVDFRYIEAARNAVSDFEVVLLDRGLFSMAAEILKDSHAKSVVFEGSFVTYSSYLAMKETLKDFTLDPNDAFLGRLRETKSPEEIRRIARAQSMGEETFRHICKLIKPGVTEEEVAIEIDYHLRKQGGEAPAFDTIAVSGRNSSKPHGVPSSKKIEAGDFVTMDFGTKVEGYCSDMTRTVAVGNASDEMKKVYETVRSAQSAALAGIRAGIAGKKADALARSVIEEAGFGLFFGHSLGHGVGLEIHEEPRFAASFEGAIPEGAVVSVEPGIYIPGRFGVRIEDLVVVEKDGVKNLNTLGSELIIL